VFTDPEDVLHADSCVINSSPGGGEVVRERVLGVAAAGVDGDMLMMDWATESADKRPGVALIDDDVYMSSTTVAEVRLELSQRVVLVGRRLHATAAVTRSVVAEKPRDVPY